MRRLWDRYRRWRKASQEREEALIRKKGRLRYYGESTAKVVFAVLLLRCFVVEAYEIPSGSMIPTLQVGDRIFVNKFIHGWRIPFTRKKVLTDIVAPKRGEIVVFVHPKEEDGRDLIKRVVAVAGDTVAVREGVVYINGKPEPREAVPGDCRYRDYDETNDRWLDRDCDAWHETVDGKTYTTFSEPGQPPSSFGPVTVPAGNIFVLGDNRDNSSDSRYWGFVPDELIEGQAMIVWWSSSDQGIRFSRFLHLLH
jgi:signal peptidase I